MRLWTLHPHYLDSRGLVALWREALLAQAVLRGDTRGYTRHPQLNRFRAAPSPVEAIAAYLREVQGEAVRRGYRFDVSKIAPGGPVSAIEATQGQMDYEWAHLRAKLQQRDPAWLEEIGATPSPMPHPLFRIVAGGIADWEVVSPGQKP